MPALEITAHAPFPPVGATAERGMIEIAFLTVDRALAPWLESLVAEFGLMPIYNVLDHLADDPSPVELAAVDYLDSDAVARTLSAIHTEVSR